MRLHPDKERIEKDMAQLFRERTVNVLKDWVDTCQHAGLPWDLIFASLTYELARMLVMIIKQHSSMDSQDFMTLCRRMFDGTK